MTVVDRFTSRFTGRLEGAPGAAVQRWAIDLGLVAVAAVEAWIDAAVTDPVAVASAAVAVGALLLRRWAPLLVFVAVVPGLFLSGSVIAAVIGLYTLARYRRSAWVTGVAAVTVVLGFVLPWPPPDLLAVPQSVVVLTVIYAVMTAAAPTLLGQLVAARQVLSEQLGEIRQGRESERRLLAESAAARERARLAREMHDVVSHQVSLIAVRAAALQVSTSTAATADAAATIRQLSVDTLDELRHMVIVLRAAGIPATELAPQPTLADLDRLIAASGIAVQRSGDVPDDLDPTVQRAIYRTVQEALTNVRKHAPGSDAAVHLAHDSAAITVTITNSAPTQPRVELPSAHHGLIGLRERAGLLGGTLESGPTPAGGYRVVLRVPRTSGAAAPSSSAPHPPMPPS